MRKYLPFITLLFINFFGLYLGGLATDPGVQSDWYQNLNQAPWKPPGFIIGIVWTIIGITWSIIGHYVWKHFRRDMDVYMLGVLLNITWCPLFFTFHSTLTAGIVIILLALTVFYILERMRKGGLFLESLFGYLYFFWLMVATSINWFIIFMN